VSVETTSAVRKKRREYETLSVVLGKPRAYKAVDGDEIYLVAVRVQRRVDTRLLLVEYQPGWAVVSRESYERDLVEPTRFHQRSHVGHDDLPEYIRVLGIAQTEGAALTHRLEIDV
jgi:hypothetical protein